MVCAGFFMSSWQVLKNQNVGFCECYGAAGSAGRGYIDEFSTDPEGCSHLCWALLKYSGAVAVSLVKIQSRPGLILSILGLPLFFL